METQFTLLYAESCKDAAISIFVRGGDLYRITRQYPALGHIAESAAGVAARIGHKVALKGG